MATDETQFPYGLSKYDADFLKAFHMTLKELRGLVISNVEFYQRGSSSVHARYYAASCILFERLQNVEPQIIDLVPRLQAFDFSLELQGNGYRSFVIIMNRCILHLLQLCRHISVNKNNLLFRSTYYLKELEAYVETLGQLVACLCYLKKLISLSKDGDLFYEDENPEGDEILLEIEMLNTDTFYGRCLGFQFSESIQKLLQGIMVAMATFSECYEEPSQVIQLASSLLNSSKYLVDQEMRAKQVVNVTRTADIKFCKAFWSIPESPVLHNLRSFTFPVVEVSDIITLQPENFDLPLVGRENETVTITPPCAHTGPAPVNVRLISHVVREGMEVNKKPKKSMILPQPKSKGLLFHCHGGGFVAQSSQSHENYLRSWARKLKMPILSVDYSLAPALPFPRALEECFYAYAWALKNRDLLGWTGELVCFAGDSAGGNLVISTALRAVSYGIRVPDGIMAAYPSLLVQYTPSPARLMAMIDPLLPVGILTRCLAVIMFRETSLEKDEVYTVRFGRLPDNKMLVWSNLKEVADAYAGIAEKFSSALAEPIFCNPGDYEHWEVVDSDDVRQDSVGAQINKKLKSQDGTCIDDVEETLDAASSYQGVTNENSTSCHSLEDLDDEFVVCDTNDLNRDVLHHKGKLTVISRESKCDSNTNDDIDIDVNCDYKEDIGERGVKTTENTTRSSLITNTTTSFYLCDSVQTEKKMEDKTKDYICETPQTIAETTSDNQNNQKGDSLNHNEPSDIDRKLMDEVPISITNALDQLDSDVIITVDAEKVAHDTDSYAVGDAKELEQDNRFITVDNLSDFDRQSCHSIEDINDKIANPENKNCLYHDNSNEKDFRSDERGHVKAGCSFSNSSLTTRVHSEPLLDTGDESHKDEQQLQEERKTVLNIQSHQHEIVDGLHRRSVSPDFPTSFHGSQSSSDLVSSMTRTPLSPKLPPGSRSFTPKRYSVQRKITQSPIKLFRQLPIVKNFYMSPILAPDELLLALPHIYLVACHFDPLLDDSIMFAKKLSKLGKTIDLQLMDHLPHGFLSLSDTSVEAKKAASVCLENIAKVLQSGMS